MRILVLPTTVLIFLACLALSLPLTQARAAEEFTLGVSTDRPDAIYATGDEVCFEVKVGRGSEAVKTGSVSYVLSEDGLTQLGAGAVDLSGEPVVIKGQMSKPGFLRCRVTFKTPDGKSVGATAGAAVSPEKIGLSMPVPGRF